MSRPGAVVEVDRNTPPTLFHFGEGFRLENLPLGSRILYPPDPIDPIPHPERAKDRQCNPGTALPSSVRRNFCLAIFAHEGGTLFPREESANNATVAALYERRRCNAQQSNAQLRSST